MANWRTAFKSDFLASWDIDSNIVLTIKHVEVKDVQLQKKEKKVVAYFVETQFANKEPIKPMVLNATNCKKLNQFTGTKETDNWKNIKVEIGVVENKGRIGEAMGLAIIKVLSPGVNLLEKLKTLYSEVKEIISKNPEKSMTEEEQIAMDRIISQEEANSYEKAIKFLESKKQA